MAYYNFPLALKFLHVIIINYQKHKIIETGQKFSLKMWTFFSAIPGRLLRCVRCPTAYHTGDFCIAAGSENLPGHNIVCSKHFQPNRTQKYHTHINVSWCFVCNLGKDKLIEQRLHPI